MPEGHRKGTRGEAVETTDLLSLASLKYGGGPFHRIRHSRRREPMDNLERAAPRARDARLVIQELPDELLVYDLERHRAHSLNRTAALVWRHCDWKKSES